MKYLIIGGNSYAAQNAIKAIRQYNENAEIIASTSTSSPIESADHTLFEIDLNSANAVSKVVEDCNSMGIQDIEWLIYTPAFGRVGIPIDRSTAEDVQGSINFSFRPMLELMERLQPKNAMCFSGYYWLESLLRAYGAMALTKIAMEQTAIRFPEKIKIVRSGLFPSKSLRGILLLSQRTLMKDTYEELRPLYISWKDSGKKFADYFYDFAYNCEKEMLDEKSLDFRPTTGEDIQKAIIQFFEGETAPIVNTMAGHTWTDNTMPELPGVLVRNQNLIPNDLYTYFKEEASGVEVSDLQKKKA